MFGQPRIIKLTEPVYELNEYGFYIKGKIFTITDLIGNTEIKYNIFDGETFVTLTEEELKNFERGRKLNIILNES
jgi:hypothetical protein